FGVSRDGKRDPGDSQSAGVERDGVISAGQTVGRNEIAADVLTGGAAKGQRAAQHRRSLAVNETNVAGGERRIACAVSLAFGVSRNGKQRRSDGQSVPDKTDTVVA